MRFVVIRCMIAILFDKLTTMCYFIVVVSITAYQLYRIVKVIVLGKPNRNAQRRA